VWAENPASHATKHQSEAGDKNSGAKCLIMTMVNVLLLHQTFHVMSDPLQLFFNHFFSFLLLLSFFQQYFML
jgi:hypothetical protein